MFLFLFIRLFFIYRIKIIIIFDLNVKIINMNKSKTIEGLTPAKLWSHFYDLIQIPRPTGQMKEVIEFIKNFGKSLNLEVKEDEVGNVLITKPASKGKEKAPVVILQSHLDMVPQKNSDKIHDFTKDPIELIIEGNKARANNTTLGADNGIGVAAMMCVLEDDKLQHPKLECLFTIDEEVGMGGAFGLKKGFLNGDILLNLDTEDEGELTVGCAGGADVTATFGFKEIPSYPEEIAYKVSIKNLKGGHSGCDIEKGRGNANKLIARFLKTAIFDCDIRISHISGGSLRNAIPREAEAVITLLPGNESTFMDTVSEMRAIYMEEYGDVEPNLTLDVEKVDMPATLIPVEIQDSLINAMVGVQNGVASMLTSFPGIVETSSNMSFVKKDNGEIVVGFLVRSSSETRKEELCSAIESVFSLAGAKVEFSGSYPGWQPNAHSKTADLMRRLFKEMFGKDATISVVHAGLECGIILDSTPGLDIVSFGPNIFNPHSPTEYAEIDSVERFYDYLKETLKRID